jgi:hypothetical protein
LILENQWNKALLRKIVLSATYRQSSKASKELLTTDPDNRLMARGFANRLTAEMIRDNALVASGLFKNEIGGKSIKPYQPEGLWAINGDTYLPDSTNDIYKKFVYAYQAFCTTSYFSDVRCYSEGFLYRKTTKNEYTIAGINPNERPYFY